MKNKLFSTQHRLYSVFSAQERENSTGYHVFRGLREVHDPESLATADMKTRLNLKFGETNVSFVGVSRRNRAMVWPKKSSNADDFVAPVSI